MITRPHFPPKAPTRDDVELMIAVAWNADGATRGLLPLSWHLGADDFVHFIASADAYARECRREIIESWIASFGFADDIDPIISPLNRRGADMIWTGDIGGISVEFSYPATIDA
jgi:hypothetical protein